MATESDLERLKNIGFIRAGCWKMVDNGIAFELNELATARNVLYSFVVDGHLVYIGKTTKSLHKRMQSYKTPAKNPAQGGTTNIKNNQNILDNLEQGKTVQIFALPDNGLLKYGGFHVNLAAGLEDSLVRELNPLWNGAKMSQPSAD